MLVKNKKTINKINKILLLLSSLTILNQESIEARSPNLTRKNHGDDAAEERKTPAKKPPLQPINGYRGIKCQGKHSHNIVKETLSEPSEVEMNLDSVSQYHKILDDVVNRYDIDITPLPEPKHQGQSFEKDVREGVDISKKVKEVTRTNDLENKKRLKWVVKKIADIVDHGITAAIGTGKEVASQQVPFSSTTRGIRGAFQSTENVLNLSGHLDNSLKRSGQSVRDSIEDLLSLESNSPRKERRVSKDLQIERGKKRKPKNRTSNGEKERDKRADQNVLEIGLEMLDKRIFDLSKAAKKRVSEELPISDTRKKVLKRIHPKTNDTVYWANDDDRDSDNDEDLYWDDDEDDTDNML